MPVVTLRFKLPEEREEFEITQKAGAMHSALWEIAQEVFRPARKHGYPDSDISQALQYLDSLAEQAAASEGKELAEIDATYLISLLEKEFYRILEDNQVEV